MTIKSQAKTLPIHHSFGKRLEEVLLNEEIDCLVADSEDGFSQLGEERQFLSQELGYADTSLNHILVKNYPYRLEPSIGQLADWCRGRPNEITLVVMPSRRLDSKLRGLILSPYDGAQCYLKFANGQWAKPHRDFMYHVAWEAFYQAFHRLSSTRPAVMHLSRERFERDTTYCQVEAALNFHDQYSGLQSVTFLDPFAGNPVSAAVKHFEGGMDRSPHRPFKRYSTEEWGIHFVTISWR
jgi:hypothetical protein